MADPYAVLAGDGCVCCNRWRFLLFKSGDTALCPTSTPLTRSYEDPSTVPYFGMCEGAAIHSDKGHLAYGSRKTFQR